MASRTGARAISRATRKKTVRATRTERDLPATTPVTIRTQGVELAVTHRDRVRDVFVRKLGKFSRHLSRVSVRLERDSNVRGDRPWMCRVRVLVPHLEPVVVEASDPDMYAAADNAAARVARAVRRVVDQR